MTAHKRCSTHLCHTVSKSFKELLMLKQTINILKLLLTMWQKKLKGLSLSSFFKASLVRQSKRWAKEVQALDTNIRLACKKLDSRNTLAYFTPLSDMIENITLSDTCSKSYTAFFYMKKLNKLYPWDVFSRIF
jgi:hypothetical protein